VLVLRAKAALCTCIAEGDAAVADRRAPAVRRYDAAAVRADDSCGAAVDIGHAAAAAASPTAAACLRTATHVTG
jgi:hypothetical protein